MQRTQQLRKRASENLAALCQEAGLTIGKLEGDRDDRLYVCLPNDRFRTSRDEIVIDINGAKYRKVDEKSILTFNNIIYEEFDAKMIVSFPKQNNMYSLKVEDEQKKPPSGNRWIEEIVPAIIIDVPENEIRQIIK